MTDFYANAIQRASTRQMDMQELLGTAEQLKPANPAAVVELYKTWIACNGDHPMMHIAYFNYAVAMSDLQDLTGAVNALREAIRMAPNFFPPYINLGGLLERLGQADKAVGTWNTLIDTCSAVTPDAVNFKLTAIKQTARIYENVNNDEPAENLLWHSLQINKNQMDVIQHYLALRQRQCKWPVVIPTDQISKSDLLAGISPLSVANYTDDPMFHLACSYMYNRKSIGFPTIKSGEPWEKPTKIGKGKLRIGYVSSDLRQHAVGFGMTDVFECHDRKNYEIFAYYCGIRQPDSTQERIKKNVDHWLDINDMDDETAARRIREDKIDILIDLNGYTKDARTRIFALQPAPINVNWFGFPNSMGSPYHHYIIADDYIIPPAYERFYTEKVLRLPCYQANDRKRVIAERGQTRAEAGLPEDAFVFCCLNGMQKVTELMFNHWMTIVSQVPGSVIWLFSGTNESNERLRKLAEAKGVAGDRLVFADKMNNPDHLARYPLADLFLDSFPYGSHTTAADAMWMGVPIVTYSGRSFASRVCGSLVNAAGFPELVAESPEDYVRLAINLAKKKSKLKEIRTRLIENRHSALLFDMTQLTRNLEALYEQMREEFQRGELPVPDLRNLALYHEIGINEDIHLSELQSNEQYVANYREKLHRIHSLYPIDGDIRLWNNDEIDLNVAPVSKRNSEAA